MTNEQIAILDHTLHRAAGNVYCGDSPDMQGLVKLGYMVSLGKPKWSCGEYFRITQAGRTAFMEAKGASNER